MKIGKTKTIVKYTLFLLVLVLFFCVILKLFSPSSIYFNDTQYYAVFLNNGQVYFGKIKNLDIQTLVLSDVYYLRANTNLQDAQNQKEANVELSLIKLGNELHGPKDQMTINRTGVLFWEELRSDGKVMQAIRKNQP